MKSIYEAKGSLFVLFVLMRSTNRDASDRALGSLESSQGERLCQLGFMAFGLTV